MYETIHAILNYDLGLIKKSARRVPKLLSSAKKKRSEWTAAATSLHSFGGTHWQS
jgi:hypothetical protein